MPLFSVTLLQTLVYSKGERTWLGFDDFAFPTFHRWSERRRTFLMIGTFVGNIHQSSPDDPIPDIQSTVFQTYWVIHISITVLTPNTRFGMCPTCLTYIGSPIPSSVGVFDAFFTFGIMIFWEPFALRDVDGEIIGEHLEEIPSIAFVRASFQKVVTTATGKTFARIAILQLAFVLFAHLQFTYHAQRCLVTLWTTDFDHPKCR